MQTEAENLVKEEIVTINVVVTKANHARLKRVKKQTGISIKAMIAQSIQLLIESIDRNMIESERA